MRTGDTGCWLENGSIVVLGRADAQIKLRGHRSSWAKSRAFCGSVLESRTRIASVHSRTGDGQLVAYFTASPRLDPADLRRHLAKVLPPHLVPSAFMQVEAIPLSAAGKVDRKSLPLPETLAATDSSQRPQPRNSMEQVVASAWEEVLGHCGFGIHDSFFEVGGDSIKAILLSGRLRRQGLRLDIRDITQLRTIAGSPKRSLRRSLILRPSRAPRR